MKSDTYFQRYFQLAASSVKEFPRELKSHEKNYASYSSHAHAKEGFDGTFRRGQQHR